MEPQLDDYSNYCEEPGIGVNSVLLNSLGTQWPNNMESDDSEDDDMLPTEEYWAIPDDHMQNHVVLGSDTKLPMMP